MSHINIHHVDNTKAGDEPDTVIVIDVIRAFTTAAFALEAGAERILLVSSVEEAFDLKNRFPEALLMGEVKSYPIEGFDFANSPAEISGLDLHGKTMVQRTSTGTQGAVASKGAMRIYATGLCNARATALAVLKDRPKSLTLVETGVRVGGWGEEDLICGAYMVSILRENPMDPEKVVEQVRGTRSARLFSEGADPMLPRADLELALEVNRFDWVMKAEQMEGLLVLVKNKT